MSRGHRGGETGRWSHFLVHGKEVVACSAAFVAAPSNSAKILVSKMYQRIGLMGFFIYGWQTRSSSCCDGWPCAASCTSDCVVLLRIVSRVRVPWIVVCVVRVHRLGIHPLRVVTRLPTITLLLGSMILSRVQARLWHGTVAFELSRRLTVQGVRDMTVGAR